jgi:Protein of unknown function (DUF1326)
LVACNCDYGCPCNFNALPTQGKCEGGWTWHVDGGGFDVTGAEVHPSAVLPEGIVFKRGDFGSSKTFRVSDGILLEHPGHYTAVGPFEYAGP